MHVYAGIQSANHAEAVAQCVKSCKCRLKACVFTSEGGGGGWVLGGWLGVGGGEVVMLLGIFTRYFDVNILKVQ